MDVIAAYQQVGTYRGAAAMCGTTHKTVKRIIQAAREGEVGGQRRSSPRRRNYDSVAALVADKVDSSKGRISAKRLLPAARAAGYDGSPRNFRRLVADAKDSWRRGHARGRRPGVWAPGETLLIDWGVEGGLHVFCAVLPGPAGGSSASPATRRPPPRSVYWRSASRPSAASRRSCWPTGWAV